MAADGAPARPRRVSWFGSQRPRARPRGATAARERDTRHHNVVTQTHTDDPFAASDDEGGSDTSIAGTDSGAVASDGGAVARAMGLSQATGMRPITPCSRSSIDSAWHLRSRNVVGRLLQRELHGGRAAPPCTAAAPYKAPPRRLQFLLRAIMTVTPDAMRCVFLGFTADGGHLVSYTFVPFRVQWWRLVQHDPATLRARQRATAGGAHVELVHNAPLMVGSEFGRFLSGAQFRLAVLHSPDQRLFATLGCTAEASSGVAPLAGSRTYHVTIGQTPAALWLSGRHAAPAACLVEEAPSLGAISFSVLVMPPYPRPDASHLVSFGWRGHRARDGEDDGASAATGSHWSYGLVINQSDCIRVWRVHLRPWPRDQVSVWDASPASSSAAPTRRRAARQAVAPRNANGTSTCAGAGAGAGAGAAGDRSGEADSSGGDGDDGSEHGDGGSGAESAVKRAAAAAGVPSAKGTERSLRWTPVHGATAVSVRHDVGLRDEDANPWGTDHVMYPLESPCGHVNVVDERGFDLEDLVHRLVPTVVLDYDVRIVDVGPHSDGSENMVVTMLCVLDRSATTRRAAAPGMSRIIEFSEDSDADSASSGDEANVTSNEGSGADAKGAPARRRGRLDTRRTALLATLDCSTCAVTVVPVPRGHVVAALRQLTVAGKRRVRAASMSLATFTTCLSKGLKAAARMPFRHEQRSRLLTNDALVAGTSLQRLVSPSLPYAILL